MIALAMLGIMAVCAVLLFLKGTFLQGVTLILNAVLAGFVAFGFFEMLADFLARYSAGIAAWAPMICFLLLFVLTLAILQTIAIQIGKEKADFGKLPEQIGRVACGIVLGYLITGHLLVAAAMGPLPRQYPYPRFDERNPNPSQPNKPLLNPDGLVTRLFATVSKGSFSRLGEPRSFAVLHADYIDSLYLNRHKVSEDVPLMTKSPVLDVPPKNGVWHAPAGLRDAEGKPLSARAGESLMLVRVGLRTRAMRETGKFSLSQLRLVCGPRGGDKPALAGQGHAVYPIGYIGEKGRLETRPLDHIINPPGSDVKTDTMNMDLAFYVPTNAVPLLLEFKRNDVVQVSAPASDEDAPEPIPFGEPGAPQTGSRPKNRDSAKTTRSPDEERGRGLSDLSKSLVENPLE